MLANRASAIIAPCNRVNSRSARRSCRALVLLGLASATASALALASASAQAVVAAAVNTTTSLVATPNPAAASATVVLAATVTAADSSSPTGTVQFEAGGTDVGTPVTVSGGAASTTTSFAAAGPEALSAVFTPANSASYNGSTGTFAETVQAAGSTTAGTVAVGVTVPQTGTFSVTVGPGAVTLSPASPATSPDETATGTLNQVTVNDSRNTFPGWSVSGQESVFTGSGAATIPANSLGWTPTVVGSLVDGAVLGDAVAPVGANAGSTGPGLGTAAMLGYAAAGCGFGANVLSANLLLDIPSSTPPGSYAGTLTITYIETQPSGVAGCEPVGVTF